jgi:type III restriction enzyme
MELRKTSNSSNSSDSPSFMPPASSSALSHVKYDLLGKIAETKKLARTTVASILQGIRFDTFAQYRFNPEDFLLKAASIINEQKATVIIEHLAYNPVDDTYSPDIFTAAKAKEDFSKADATPKRHIYDYVFTDSTNEKNFVTHLDTSQEIVVYAKVPRGFSIPTPVGEYNPDWAIAFDGGQSEAHLLHR